jgi:hypothetical protein
MDNKSMQRLSGNIIIKDNDYTDAASFKSAMSGVLLCYQLADPTQGNCIAVKTDNGSGIDGTMAVFETGTPLYAVSDSVRDVMHWDGSSGEVTKRCRDRELSSYNWGKDSSGDNIFYLYLADIASPQYKHLLSTDKYTYTSYTTLVNTDMSYTIVSPGNLVIHDSNYIDATAFKNSLSGAHLIYELATPTTEQLTTAENASLAGLRTFEPQTHAQNNAQTDMTVDYTIRVPTI